MVVLAKHPLVKVLYLKKFRWWYYMIILFIKPNRIEIAGDRLLEIEDNEWSIVKKLISIGEQLVDLAKENEDNND